MWRDHQSVYKAISKGQYCQEGRYSTGVN